LSDPQNQSFGTSFEWLQSQLGFSDINREEIYHYTDQKGFLGIRQEQKIRATHVGFLNDKSEIEHAAKKMIDQLVDRRNRAVPELPLLLEWMIKSIKHITADMTGLYVASFSANADSLPQWDRYTSDFGYALGFDVIQLDLVNRIDATTVLNSHLIKILYEDEEKRLLIDQTITNLLARAAAAGVSSSSTDTSFAEWSTDYLQCMSLLFTGLKHSAYSSEEEYRFVVMHALATPSFAREGRHGIVPYVNLEPRDVARLPLRSVVVGPSHYPDSAKFAVQQFLLGDLAPGAVSSSRIPKRT